MNGVPQPRNRCPLQLCPASWGWRRGWWKVRNPGQPEAWLPRRWVCIQTHHARRGMGPAGAGTVLPCGPGGLTGSGCCSPQGSEVDACPPHRRSATASKGVLQALLAPRREACVCTPFPHPVGPQRGGRARRAAGGHRNTCHCVTGLHTLGCCPWCLLPTRRRALHSQTASSIVPPGARPPTTSTRHCSPARLSSAHGALVGLWQ